MQDPRPITALPDDAVLNWWANAPAGEDYAHVVSMARTRGCRTTVDKVRRDIRRRLRRLQLLPVQRPPTSQDYLDAKVKWRAGWYEQEIV